MVSSRGHVFSKVELDDLPWKRRGYGPWIPYGQSKTANVLMAYEIEKRYVAEI